MLYLLDANVPIDANRDYYPIDRVPEFWDWLVRMGQSEQVKFPQEIYEEVSAGNDAAAVWIRENANSMLLNEVVLPQMVARATTEGYATDLTDDEIEKVGRDPFLIAYALADHRNRVVVTNESSKPSRTRANRHLPDACDEVGVLHCNAFELIRRLDFRTR